MEKQFQVKRVLFETTAGDEVCRFMLTDRLLPMLAPNQYIEMKSINKLGTGKSYAYKLCVYFNFSDNISFDSDRWIYEKRLKNQS